MKRILLLSLPLILLLSLSAFAQQNLTLIVTGQPGQTPIVQMNGKSYVDIDALARLTNSSVSFKGNQVILTPPGSAPSTPPADPEPSAPAGQLKLVAAEDSQRIPSLRSPPRRRSPPPPTKRQRQPHPRRTSTAALAKAAQNPVANLISFPLQNNTNFGIGPYQRDPGRAEHSACHPASPHEKVEPDHPHHSAHRLAAERLAADGQGWYGLGDLNPSLFFSPAKPGKLIWGVGPALVFPTATAPRVGTGKSQRGPGRRRPDHSRSLGHRRSGEQCLVVCRYGQPSAGESVPAAVLH